MAGGYLCCKHLYGHPDIRCCGIIGGSSVSLSLSLGVVALAAGVAVGFAAVSAVGQGVSAATGIASITEKQEMFGKSIIFSIIPETQALMGFLIAILLMIGTGLMGSPVEGVSMAAAFVAVGAGVAIGLAAVSAVGQGFVVSSGISSVTADKKMFGKALLFSVLPQTQALYGFLVSILLLVGVGLLGVVNPGLTLSVGLVALAGGFFFAVWL